jgi:opacity protein-like surface antigen
MRRVLSFAALSILAVSAPLGAQRSTSVNPSPEVGFDAAITFGLSNGGGTLVDIPAQQVRMGFFVAPNISIEPTLGFHSESGGGTTVTLYTVGAGLLYHFSPSRATNQFYVRPFIDVVGFSGGGVSDSRARFGIGGGLKIPLRDRIATRLEANFSHSNGSDMLGLLAGLSFYTR